MRLLKVHHLRFERGRELIGAEEREALVSKPFAQDANVVARIPQVQGWKLDRIEGGHRGRLPQEAAGLNLLDRGISSLLRGP